MQEIDVLIIGGGAAGLMCAQLAAKRGRSVVVLEKAKKPGRKILMSGGGRCNFTNLNLSAENFICANPHFVKSALSRFNQWDFIAMVESYQIAYEEREFGQLFCKNSAKEIVQMLLHLCAQSGVEIRCAVEVEKVEKQQEHWRVSTAHSHYRARSLIIASGGLSIPSMGGDGFGYRLAEQLGINVLARRAGLVPFTLSGQLKTLSETLSGVAVPVSAQADGPAFEAALLFTHRGLSGPAMLQISNYWDLGANIYIDLAPKTDLSRFLLEAKAKKSRSSLRTVLMSFWPRSMCLALEAMFWPIEADLALGAVKDDRLKDIAANLQRLVLKPSGTEGYRTAELTLGGVDTNALSSKTMASKAYQNLYFIGETVDVGGWLGGYNFQWAWSSAFAAASDC